MSDTGSAETGTVRRHAARAHRVRGQHRASWIAELAPLLEGTQRRYTAVVGSAVAASSVVAMATAGALPSGEPDPAASQAMADIAATTERSERHRGPTAPEQDPPPAAAPPGPTEGAAPTTAGAPDPERVSPVAPQPPQVAAWAPMLDEVVITSRYGPRWGRTHNGIDFAAATGTPIYAGRQGTVTYAGWETGFGNLVVIDHGEGVETYYAHNSALSVHEGQRVTTGQHIADAGDTGFSLGPHLHFEVHVDGQPVEPIAYLEAAGLRLE